VKQLEDCRRKTRYATEREAEDAAYRARMEKGVELRTYACPWCHGWHLTRPRGKGSPGD
jgi:hypothetical protein